MATSDKPLPYAFAGDGNLTTELPLVPNTANDVCNYQTGYPDSQMQPLSNGGVTVKGTETNGALNFLSKYNISSQLGKVYDVDVSVNDGYQAYRNVVRAILNGTPIFFISKIDKPTGNPVTGTSPNQVINSAEWERYGEFLTVQRQYVDETNNRSAGVTYTNDNSYDIRIIVRFLKTIATENQGFNSYIYVDGIIVAEFEDTITGESGFRNTLYAVIPPNSEYMATFTNPAHFNIENWLEYK